MILTPKSIIKYSKDLNKYNLKEKGKAAKSDAKGLAKGLAKMI